MHDVPSVLRFKPPQRLRLIGIAAVCVAVVVVVLGLLTRVLAAKDVADWTKSQGTPTVKVLDLAKDDNAGTLVLPGDVQAFNSAPIYARVSGYLKSWAVDIGTPVKAGQVLAEIDIPDQDQQLTQAKADLASAVANEKLAQSTAKRWNELVDRGVVARQDADEKNGDLAAKHGATQAAKANVDRLQALEGFKHITAPFDGIVTSRATQIGALINVGAATATPLFTVSDISKLRIYVRVPQSYSAQVAAGMTANFTVPEYPGKNFTASVVATANAVDQATGAVLVQLQLDNTSGALKPGEYATVHFALRPREGAIRLPVSALMFRDTGMAVAIVGPQNHVFLKPVTIAHDFGPSVEIASGLALTDKVIDNPPDSIREGDIVNIAPPQAPAPKTEGKS